MNTAMTTKFSILLACIGVCLCAAACANPRAQAAKALEQQLAGRREGRAKSMRAYTRALEALDDADSAGARKHLNRAIAQDNNNAHAWMALGALEHDQGNLHEAAQAFDRAARLAPLRYEPHYNLGMIFESVRKYPQAIREYETALKYAPHQVEVMENLARCYIATRTRPEDARELVSRALNAEYRPEWVRWLRKQQSRLSGDREAPRR